MADTDAPADELEALRAQVKELTHRLSERETHQAEQTHLMENMIDELRERAELLSQSEAALRRQSTLLHWMLDNMSDGLVVLDEQGTHLLSNRAAETVIGDIPMGLPLSWSHGVESQRGPTGLFEVDGTTRFPTSSTPLMRALKGEEVRDVEMFVRKSANDAGVYLSVNATPLKDETGIRGAVGVFRDITERKRHEDELAKKNRELLEAERARIEASEKLRLSQEDLIRRQELALQELSTPILDIWESVLALPIIGIVDSSRSAQIMEKLLSAVVAKRCRWVLIDVTGVDVIDTHTASHFLRIAEAVRLMGARCILTGMKPAVAQTIVQLDVDLSSMQTHRNLRQGLRYCIEREFERRVLDHAANKNEK